MIYHFYAHLVADGLYRDILSACILVPLMRLMTNRPLRMLRTYTDKLARLDLLHERDLIELVVRHHTEGETPQHLVVGPPDQPTIIKKGS